MANLNPDQIRRLARLGAVSRLEQLREEEAAIRAEFPELFGRGRREAETAAGRGRGRRRAAAVATVAAGRGAARRRGRKPMSAAARKAVSERMRKYWADRRKAKAGK